jgi:hypothetical protein
VCRRPTGRRGGWGRGVFPQVRRGVLAGGGSALGRIRTCNLLIRRLADRVNYGIYLRLCPRLDPLQPP